MCKVVVTSCQDFFRIYEGWLRDYNLRMYELLLLGTSVAAGFLGSLLGLGGGIIIVPTLTLFFHVDIRYAIAASLISIVATSSGAAASYLKDHLTNLRVAVLLEVGTVTGAMLGFVIAKHINSRALFLLFGFFLLFSAFMMLRKREEQTNTLDHPWSKRLKLAGSFPNAQGGMTDYGVANAPAGLIAMFFAGVLSAFLLRGDVRPEIAAPVSVGIIIGSYIGAKMMVKMPASLIRKIFVVVLSIVSVQMILKGFA